MQALFVVSRPIELLAQVHDQKLSLNQQRLGKALSSLLQTFPATVVIQKLHLQLTCLAEIQTVSRQSLDISKPLLLGFLITFIYCSRSLTRLCLSTIRTSPLPLYSGMV